MNLKTLTAKLQSLGMPRDIEVAVGFSNEGDQKPTLKHRYFYFFGGNTDSWSNGTIAIGVNKINDITVEQWLERYKEMSGDDCMVTRTNILSGKEYQEQRNTPNYLSPASEAYHCM